MEEIDQPEEIQSAYNMSFSTLARINYWLYNANNYNFNNDPYNYFRSLSVIYNEVYPFINEDRAKKHNKTINLIEAELVIFQNKLSNSGRAKLNFIPNRELFDMLHLWDKELRNDLAKAGLYMRKGEDSSSAMV